MKFKDKRIKFIVGAVLIVTVAYWSYDQWREYGAAKEVKQMTEKMVTYCVGRYLIDLPKDTEVNYGATRIDGVDIAFLEIDAKQPLFDERLKAREDELKEQKNDLGKVSLEQVEEFNPPSLTGKLLVYGRNQTTLTRKSQPYIVENIFTQAWLRGPGTEYRLEGELDPDRASNMARLARQLRPAPPTKIPTEPGFCIERGIILDPPAPDQHESIVLHFRLKKNPDIVGNFFITSISSGPRETLLQRDAKAGLGAVLDARVSSIFKGDRTINGILGQEVSEKVHEMNGTRGHSFTWEAFGKPSDPFSPAISFDIATGYGPPGKPLNSSLPDKAANDLWQKISGSIRLRPTGPAKTSAAEPEPTDNPDTTKRLPLGTKVSSLRSCPESGIYECAADALGVTERRVFIAQGRPMPSAFVMSPKRGVSGLFGGEEQKEVELTWTLIAHKGDPT